MQSSFFRFSFIIFLGLMVNLVESYNFRSNQNSSSEAELLNNRSSDASDFKNSDDYPSASPDVSDSRIPVNQYQRIRRGLPPHHMRRMNHLNEGAPKENQKSGESSNGLRNGSPVSYKPTVLENYSSDRQMQQFLPKGSNERLSLIPYRGEFYSKGGKPFSIDPGLIGRWR